MKATHTAVLHARGFSLVEVMVAVVVICIGLLGIAKMQAMALSNTSMSRQRSLAAIEAASFASAMHSNRAYWGNLTVTLTVSITGNNVVQVVAPMPPCRRRSSSTSRAQCLPWCRGRRGEVHQSGFEQQQSLAAFDLARWWVNSVSQQLPNPTVIVTCPQVPPGNPAPVSCTVQIIWTEALHALTANEVQAQQQNGASASEKPNLHAVRRAMNTYPQDIFARAPRSAASRWSSSWSPWPSPSSCSAGLVTIVQNVRIANMNQTRLAQLQDEQRFAMTVITDAVQAGGYFGDPTTQSNTVWGPQANIAPAAAFQTGWIFAGCHTVGRR